MQRGGFETTLLFGSTTERSTVFSLGGHVNFFRFCRRAHVPNGSSAVGTLEPKFSSGRTKRPSVVWVEAFLKVRRERPASRHSLDVRCRSGRDGRLASNRQFLRSAAKTVAAGSAGSVRTASGTMSFVRRARFLLFLNGRKRFTVDNADRYATGRPSSRWRSRAFVANTLVVKSTTITRTVRPGRHGADRQNIQRLNTVGLPVTGNAASRERTRNVRQGKRVRNAEDAGKL